MLLYVSDMTEAENYYEDMEVPYYREVIMMSGLRTGRQRSFW